MKRTHRRGYALYEILFALGLVTIAMNLAFRSISSIIRINHDLPAAADALRVQRQWLDALRSDAWSADEVISPANNTHAITFKLGTTTTHWTIADNEMTRSAGEVTSSWPLSKSTGFVWDGAVLTIRQGDTIVALATRVVEKEIQP